MCKISKLDCVREETLNISFNVCRRFSWGVASKTSATQFSWVVTRTLHSGKLPTCRRGQIVTLFSASYPFTLDFQECYLS